MGLFDFFEDLKNSAECLVADAQYKVARNKYEREYGDDDEEDDEEDEYEEGDDEEDDEEDEYELVCDTLPNGLPIGLNVIRKRSITNSSETDLKDKHTMLSDMATECLDGFSESKFKKLIALICKEHLTPDLITQKYGSVTGDKINKAFALAYENGLDIEKIIIEESKNIK